MTKQRPRSDFSYFFDRISDLTFAPCKPLIELWNARCNSVPLLGALLLWVVLILPAIVLGFAGWLTANVASGIITMTVSPILRSSSGGVTYDAIIGDLEERYSILLKSKGSRAATLWFWRQFGLSVFSLILEALKRLSIL
jgi:hypothetical protein